MTHAPTQSAYTPGPWHFDWLDADNGWILDEQGNYLAEIVTGDDEGLFVSQKEQQANARLFAAAPEMLEYLKMALEDTEVLATGEGLNNWDFNLTAENLRHVIAKAEGHPYLYPSLNVP